MQGDGSLLVTEDITFAFSGDFSGAFREIPLRKGEAIDQVAVLQAGRAYRPGACAELGCDDDPDTFGTTGTEKGLRIVWHYRASNEARSFRVRYRVRGLAVAYDDVVDVNLKVWGDEWKVPLARLTAALTAQGKIERAWGHPVWVRGDVTIEGNRAALRSGARAVLSTRRPRP